MICLPLMQLSSLWARCQTEQRVNRYRFKLHANRPPAQITSIVHIWTFILVGVHLLAESLHRSLTFCLWSTFTFRSWSLSLPLPRRFKVLSLDKGCNNDNIVPQVFTRKDMFQCDSISVQHSIRSLTSDLSCQVCITSTTLNPMTVSSKYSMSCKVTLMFIHTSFKVSFLSSLAYCKYEPATTFMAT